MARAFPYVSFLVVLLCLAAVPRVFAVDVLPDVEAIVRKVDELHRSDTSYAEMEMTITTPHWKRTMELEAWTEKLDKTFIVVLSPAKEKGTATLRIDNEMWNYFPKIDKVMKVPPSMMMGDWMGSDFTNDDIVKESTLLDDYDAKLVNPEGADPENYYIELVPKEKTVTVWGKISLIVNKADLLPVQESYYDEKGKEMRKLLFSEVKDFDGKKIPSLLEMIPLSEEKEGHKTVVRYKNAKFDIEHPEDTFTLRNLRKRR